MGGLWILLSLPLTGPLALSAPSKRVDVKPTDHDELKAEHGNGNHGDTGKWLDDIEAASRKRQGEILEEYGGDRSIFEKGLYRYSESMPGISDRILTAMLHKRPFIVSIGGMSVTAGHGNYFNQSYPRVLQSAVADVFLMAGVHFRGQNAGMGGTLPMPYMFCLENFMGNPDVVSWEFGMMEAGMTNFYTTELFMRRALDLPKKPAILIISGFTPKEDEHCKAVNYMGTPGSSDPARQKYSDYYADVTETGHLNIARALCNKHYKKAGSSVPDSLLHIDTGDIHHDRYNCPKCPHQASWHPGWRVHRLRGMILAHYYLICLVKAVKTWRNLLAIGHTLSDLREEYPDDTPERDDIESLHSVHDVKLQVEKIGKGIKPEVVSDFFHGKINCRTNELPNYGPSGFTLLDAKEKGGWSSIGVVPSLKREEEETISSGANYADHKIVLMGTAQDGPVVFKDLDASSKGIIMTCTVKTGWNPDPNLVGADEPKDSKEGWGFPKKHLIWKIDGKEELPSPIDVHGMSPCLMFFVKKGKHTLSIEVRDSVPSGKFAMISHLLWA